jgi:hypothetical protein
MLICPCDLIIANAISFETKIAEFKVGFGYAVLRPPIHIRSSNTLFMGTNQSD